MYKLLYLTELYYLPNPWNNLYLVIIIHLTTYIANIVFYFYLKLHNSGYNHKSGIHISIFKIIIFVYIIYMLISKYFSFIHYFVWGKV